MTTAFAIIALSALIYAAKCRRERDVARAQRTDALRRLDAIRSGNEAIHGSADVDLWDSQGPW